MVAIIALPGDRPPSEGTSSHPLYINLTSALPANARQASRSALKNVGVAYGPKGLITTRSINVITTFRGRKHVVRHFIEEALRILVPTCYYSIYGEDRPNMKIRIKKDPRNSFDFVPGSCQIEVQETDRWFNPDRPEYHCMITYKGNGWLKYIVYLHPTDVWADTMEHNLEFSEK